MSMRPPFRMSPILGKGSAPASNNSSGGGSRHNNAVFYDRDLDLPQSAGGSTSSAGGDPQNRNRRNSDGRGDGKDERSKLIGKMDQIKEKLRGVALMQEAEVDEFCRMSRQLGGGTATDGAPDNNPQLARVRQHFEKRNKKHTHETNQLREKLAVCQTRLDELDSGVDFDGAATGSDGDGQHGFASTALGGLSSMMAMPRDLASRLRKQFGSADNIHAQAHLADKDSGPSSSRSPQLRGTNQPTFYTHSAESTRDEMPNGRSAPGPGSDGYPRNLAGFTPTHRRGKSDVPPIVNDPTTSSVASKSVSNRPMGQSVAGAAQTTMGDKNAADQPRDSNDNDNDNGSAPPPPEPIQHSMDDLRKRMYPDAGSSGALLQPLLDELCELRRRYDTMDTKLEQLKAGLQSEAGYFHSSLHEERFRCQRLEEQLNDMMELQQAESAALRHEMQHVAGRLEYQRVEAMRDLNEMFESTANRLAVVEQKCESISRGETGLRVGLGGF